MINNNKPDSPYSLSKLLFRRQFLLGPKQFMPNKHWSNIQLPHDLHLSVHNDLPFTTTSHNNITITILGEVIDPYNPEYEEADILHLLIRASSDLNTIIDSTKHYVGRWVIIFQNHLETYLFTDPCSFRQVFYYGDDKSFWCASQPELIKAVHQLSFNEDNDLLEFLMDSRHTQFESLWVGSKTLYNNCFHLMPNHYLNIGQMKQTRFYSPSLINSKDTSEIVKIVCEILQGTMTALTSRHDVSLALTAGLDSRVLLAASKHVRDRIEYYVYTQDHITENHPDIWVPKKIAKKFDIKFSVKKSGGQLPGWFISILSQNITCARVLSKTGNIYSKLINGEKSININGNGSEICRNSYDKHCELDTIDISTADLANIMFKDKELPSYVIQEINEWEKELNYKFNENLNILDLLYWEQRLGNWGAQYPAEQDIAIEEISPFNCRLLIETLLSSSRDLRAAPDYPLYQELIHHMWPEVLEFPINPHKKGNFISYIRPLIPSSVVSIIKKVLRIR